MERILEGQFGDGESTGFYEGQFKELEAFGREKAVPVLICMLHDRAYAFRRIHRRENPDTYRKTMKELAVMALGELGGAEALPALKTFLADEAQMRVLTKRVREETLVALHRHGEKSPLEEYLRETREGADRLLNWTSWSRRKRVASSCSLSGWFSIGSSGTTRRCRPIWS